MTSLRFLYGVENNYANIILTFRLEMKWIKLNLNLENFPVAGKDLWEGTADLVMTEARGMRLLFIFVLSFALKCLNISA